MGDFFFFVEGGVSGQYRGVFPSPGPFLAGVLHPDGAKLGFSRLPSLSALQAAGAPADLDTVICTVSTFF